MRRVLGGEAIGSRPYRLVPGSVDTDAAAVSALLATDVGEAVRAYPGPLLPASDAPGVVDLRDELHARVRAAVLGGGSTSDLRTWTAGPGRDDPDAWNALARVPGLAPAERATAESMVRILDDRLGA